LDSTIACWAQAFDSGALGAARSRLSERLASSDLGQSQAGRAKGTVVARWGSVSAWGHQTGCSPWTIPDGSDGAPAAGWTALPADLVAFRLSPVEDAPEPPSTHVVDKSAPPARRRSSAGRLPSAR
jgi:hypothetical protein